METSGNGDASASPASATMGQTVALTATPAEGSHFVKWEAVPGDITLNDNTFAMPASNVTVKAVFAEHTYSGWTQNDNDTHTRACTVCGVKQTEACTGGEATCTKEAVCEVCGQSYGEKDSDNHTGEPVWKQDADSHTQYYDCCGVVTVGQEPHEWEDGKCAECGYGCTHSGGTATCTARAVCELCGQPYGDLDPDNHINLTEVEAVAATQQADGNTAYWYCEECGRYFADADASEEISQEDTVIDFGTRLFFCAIPPKRKKSDSPAGKQRIE